MSLLELQTTFDGTPHYTMRTKLDGIDYEFAFRFGERRGVWVFDLATLDGVSIVSGQLVTVLRDLLRRSGAPEKPPGVLFCMNLQEPDGSDGNPAGPRELPGLYDLGDRCRMYYREAE